MAYIINKYNTEQLSVVEDGTIDQTTDLKLVGKNYAGYGEIQNENFVFLLENFAGANQPTRAITGQIWFDSGNSKLKFYDGGKWRTTGGAEVSPTQPAGLSEGDFWWHTTNKQLYAFDGTSWVLVGPQGVGATVTRFRSVTILDDANVNRPVILAIVNDEIVYIISNAQFTMNSTEEANYVGFDVIRKGLTLKNTDSSVGGVTVGDMNTGFRYWGTATNADKLGGRDASEYLLSTNPVFTQKVQFKDPGFSVGNSDDLEVRIVSDYVPLISNIQGDQLIFQVSSAVGSAVQVMPMRLTPSAILPGYASAIQIGANTVNETGTYDVSIGSSTNKFNTVYATNFNGLATSSLTLRLAGNDLSGSMAATANTVAVRDNTGDLWANIFHGTATNAQYADLAENYLADEDLPVGTIVCIGGEKEVTASTLRTEELTIGMVSSEPAYLMNSVLTGEFVKPIALKGRVPCRIEGAVKKGEFIYHSNTPGVGRSMYYNHSRDNIISHRVVGISLETSSVEEEKLIEIFIDINFKQ